MLLSWSEYFGKMPNNQLILQLLQKLILVQTSEQKYLNQYQQKYLSFIFIDSFSVIFITKLISRITIIYLFLLIRMESGSENPVIQQFRTVVMGYRLHGELIQLSNAYEVFLLEILSSSNKQEKYQITFDQLTINSYKFVGQFSTPKTLYDHLSKMTKLKLKFNSELKTMMILYDKQKCAHEIQIELLSIIQRQVEFDKKESETTFSEEKEQYFEQTPIEKSEQKAQICRQQRQEITEFDKKEQIEQPKNNSQTVELVPQYSQTTQNNEQPQNVEEKIAELQKFLQMNKPKEQLSTIAREQKKIIYNFNKSESQPYTLYQYALTFKVDQLAEIIESEQLDNTQQLDLKRNKLPEIPPFNQIVLNNLKFLSLQENKLTKICNLEFMPNLQKLNLDGNKIYVIQNLSSLANLKLLKLGNNNIRKIQGLDGLISLQTLWLDFNSIQRIEGLKSLIKLKALNLSFNMIQKMQNLEHLSNLEQLLINENQITKIQNLDKLQKLTKLSLSMNMIQKVRGLKKLLFLQVVHLNQNQIQQFDKIAFEEFNWLKMLKDVKLNANPIDWNQQAQGYLQRLKNYGVKVAI